MSTKNSIGRPAKYSPGYIKQARKLCTLGATDVDLADFFEVDVRTVQRWAARYPDFRRAIKVAKRAADENVIRSLYLRATGYAVIESKVFKLKDPETGGEYLGSIDVERRVPPDTVACIYWLNNRRRSEWSNRVEHATDVESMAELFKQLADKLPV